MAQIAHLVSTLVHMHTFLFALAHTGSCRQLPCSADCGLLHCFLAANAISFESCVVVYVIAVIETGCLLEIIVAKGGCYEKFRLRG